MKTKTGKLQQNNKKTYQIFVQLLAQVGANFHSSNKDKKQTQKY